MDQVRVDLCDGEHVQAGRRAVAGLLDNLLLHHPPGDGGPARHLLVIQSIDDVHLFRELSLPRLQRAKEMARLLTACSLLGRPLQDPAVVRGEAAVRGVAGAAAVQGRLLHLRQARQRAAAEARGEAARPPPRRSRAAPRPQGNVLFFSGKTASNFAFPGAPADSSDLLDTQAENGVH
jgi:hypothetical protein